MVSKLSAFLKSINVLIPAGLTGGDEAAPPGCMQARVGLAWKRLRAEQVLARSQAQA